MVAASKLNDPKVIGPGAWSVIHAQAIRAKTPERKRAFITLMKEICDDFKCRECGGHCSEYIKNHPMEDYLEVKSASGEDIGLFKWSWMFHNAVNARLGKGMMDYETAYGLYAGTSQVCFDGCGQGSIQSSLQEVSKRAPSLVQVLPTMRLSSRTQ